MWLIGDDKKSTSKKSEPSFRNGGTPINYRHFTIDSFLNNDELYNLNKPVCPSCVHDFTEFPKRTKVCPKCKSKLVIHKHEKGNILLTQSRKTDARLMKEICNRGREMGIPYADILPCKNHKELIGKMWVETNRMISEDFERNIRIRGYQIYLLSKENKGNGTHILNAIDSDYNNGLKVAKDLQEKINIAFTASRVLSENSRLSYKYLEQAQHFQLQRYFEDAKKFNYRGIKILGSCCDACEKEIGLKTKYSVSEVKKLLDNNLYPLPHSSCERKSCACCYVLDS